jgi:DNA-binding transcriptional LysR family regulator
MQAKGRARDAPGASRKGSGERHAVLRGDPDDLLRSERRGAAGAIEVAEHFQRLEARGQNDQDPGRRRRRVVKGVRQAARQPHASVLRRDRFAAGAADDDFAVEHVEQFVVVRVDVHRHAITRRDVLLPDHDWQDGAVRKHGQWRAEHIKGFRRPGLLDEAASARAEARALRAAPAGKLRVAAPESFGERLILPGLGRFLSRFPSIEIELAFGARHTRLVEEAFDLAIRIAEAPEPSLVVRSIGASRIVVVAAPNYLAAHGAPERPEDILGHQCVGMAAPLPWHGVWRIGGGVAVRPTVVVNSGEGLRAAAISGLGLAPMPDWLAADAISAGQLVRVLAGCEPAPAGIYAVYPTNRLLTPVVRAFVDHVAADLRACGVEP